MKYLLSIIVIFVGIMASCSSDSSEDVLSMGEMEDILYDIHLSQCMNVSGDTKSNTLKDISNREAIFKKYEITESEWDSSYTYYCRHADKLHKIYENIAERVRDEVVELGGDVALDNEHMSGDTTNIWTAERHFILMKQSPYNLRSFAIAANDSTFKVGDQITLQFNSKFIFQEGNRDLVCVMAVTLGNDSIVSQIRHVNNDGINSVVYRDIQHKGIKSIKGYFIISRNINDQPSTQFHLVSVENIRLTLAHEKEGVNSSDGKQNVSDVNSINHANDSLPDSIHSDNHRPDVMGPDKLRPAIHTTMQRTVSY